jgi:hypothetical protein
MATTLKGPATKPPTQDEMAAAILSGGRAATQKQLGEAGLNRMAVMRLVRREILVRRAHGTYELASETSGDPFPAIAARYGGKFGADDAGVVCLKAAAHLHELTDMGSHNIPHPEVALRRMAGLGEVQGLPVRIVRLRTLHEERDLEWREYGSSGIHVTTEIRTACDLYAPWAGKPCEGMAKEVLARLLARDPAAAERAVCRAEELGWGKRMRSDYQAMFEAKRFTPMSETTEIGGMSL